MQDKTDDLDILSEQICVYRVRGKAAVCFKARLAERSAAQAGKEAERQRKRENDKKRDGFCAVHNLQCKLNNA